MGTGDLLGNLTNFGEVTCDGLASRPGGVEILLAASCYGNRDKLRHYEPVWLIRLHTSLTSQAGKVVSLDGYTGMCEPKGYGFSAVLVVNRVLITADRDFGEKGYAWAFLHSSRNQGVLFRRM